MAVGDAAFVGEIPAIYEELLVPLVFAEPARRLAAAVAATGPAEILETAAGTGILTRTLLDATKATVTATDLNDPMLQEAAQLCSSDRVRWQVADALDLGFPDDSFDAVACQFGVMFFPDKPRGYAEARRVLRPGGTFFFNAWNRIEANPAWQITNDALNDMCPEEPLPFLRRTPFAYFDPASIRRNLEAGGFDDIAIDVLSTESHSTIDETARAICGGTPLRLAIEEHSTLTLEQATDIAAKALRDVYGDGSFTAPISWLQVSARAAS